MPSIEAGIWFFRHAAYVAIGCVAPSAIIGPFGGMMPPSLEAAIMITIAAGLGAGVIGIFWGPAKRCFVGRHAAIGIAATFSALASVWIVLDVADGLRPQEVEATVCSFGILSRFQILLMVAIFVLPIGLALGVAYGRETKRAL